MRLPRVFQVLALFLCGEFAQLRTGDPDHYHYHNEGHNHPEDKDHFKYNWALIFALYYFRNAVHTRPQHDLDRHIESESKRANREVRERNARGSHDVVKYIERNHERKSHQSHKFNSMLFKAAIQSTSQSEPVNAAFLNKAAAAETRE